jgi:hypothetical protein
MKENPETNLGFLFCEALMEKGHASYLFLARRQFNLLRSWNFSHPLQVKKLNSVFFTPCALQAFLSKAAETFLKISNL